jgi:clan AA aspartic protease
MIDGAVFNSQATVGIDVQNGSGQFVRIFAIVDTGYNGSIALPSKTISELALQFGGYRAAKLADGSKITLTMHTGRVIWHERPRVVSVAEGAFAPIVGMALIRGSRLAIDATDGGRVTITELGG